jgi:hypothetical protein
MIEAGQLQNSGSVSSAISGYLPLMITFARHAAVKRAAMRQQGMNDKFVRPCALAGLRFRACDPPRQRGRF